MNAPDKLKLKQWFILAAILCSGIAILWSLRGFLTSLLGALIFFVLFRPFMLRLVDAHRWKKGRAAWLILIISFLIFIVPLAVSGYLLYHEIMLFANSPSALLEYVYSVDKLTQQTFGFELLKEESIEKVKMELLGWVSSALNGTMDLVGILGIMYFILYYLLMYAKEVAEISRHYSPFVKGENNQLFIEELKLQTHSNTLAVPVLAITQGIAATAGFWIFGLDQPVFWGIISGFFSIIPVVGTAIIWIPAGMLLFASQGTWQGVGMLAYGALIISNIDNLMRLLLQKQFADVHPVTTVFGVIVGLNLFGLPGLIFGPLLISYFLILIKVYRNEYWKEDTYEQ
jgi:predicted PurR-regulated permease PerM